jgi:hypothetical protein
MARKKKCKVFVSYSRHDEALVKPLAGLLGVAADDAVFLDVASLKPGDLWEKKIIDAVKEASVLVVCWCCQSNKSVFVAREISTALAEGKKKLVPVLFCTTPLPPNIADRQWIDLCGKIVHDCSNLHARLDLTSPGGAGNTGSAARFEVPPSSTLPERSAAAPRIKRAAVAIVSLLGIIAIVAYLAGHSAQNSGGRHPSPPAYRPSPPPYHPSLPAYHASPPAYWEYIGLGIFVLVSLAAIVAAAFLLMKLFRAVRKWHERRQAQKIAATATSYFEHLAEK